MVSMAGEGPGHWQEATPCIYIHDPWGRHPPQTNHQKFGRAEQHDENSLGWAEAIRTVKLDTEDTMIAFDVAVLFTCIPTSDAVSTLRRQFFGDSTFSDRIQLSPDHILLSLSEHICCTGLWQGSLVMMESLGNRGNRRKAFRELSNLEKSLYTFDIQILPQDQKENR